MTITYTEVNVTVGDKALWKREVADGKLIQEMEWLVATVGEEPDCYCWAYRTHSYKQAIIWMKEQENEEEE